MTQTRMPATIARSDADQNLAAETRAIGDDATAVLRIVSGGSGRGGGVSRCFS